MNAVKTTTTSDNGRIRHEHVAMPLTVDKVYVGDYQKEGTLSAQIRQVINTTSFYPSKQISNDMQDNIFTMDEFGFDESEYTSTENRVAWIDVPVGTTKQQVEQRLEALDGACIYKVLSNRPILTSGQAYAINNPALDATLDTFANSQVVRYPQGHEREGQIILDPKGKVQYRATFFSRTPKADDDRRTADANDVYMSPAIQNEIMAGAPAGAHVEESQSI